MTEENKVAGITLKQMKFIQTLAKRHNKPEPDYDNMSINDAKAWIEAVLPEQHNNGAPTGSHEPSKFDDTILDVLRQILAELKNR